jgi:ribonuclease R
MSDIPTKAQILDWIAAHPGATSKRDIAKAFHVKGRGADRPQAPLKELEEEGHLEKRRKTYRDPDKLPPVAVLQVLPADDLGDLFCKPLEWHGEGPEPRVLFSPRATDPASAKGDRILARLQEVRARIISMSRG